MTNRQLSLFPDLENLESKLKNHVENSKMENPTAEIAEYWARIARIALPRFSELERGEHITYKEIRDRLRALKKEGYPIGDYKKMKRGEMYHYLIHEIRPIVRGETKKFCPEVRDEIDRKNRESKESVFLYR